MARMYPTPINADTESSAERKLYAAFRDYLDDDYIIFHSVAWQSLTQERRPRDGEADFVLAHPRYGILVMEAKGGHICFDPHAGTWTSTSANGITHDIKDPFQQAKDSKYILRDQLARMLNTHKTNIIIGHAVAFPDVTVPNTMGLDKPRETILDQHDMLTIDTWVQQALGYWSGQHTSKSPLPDFKPVVDALMRLLGKVRELHPVLWGTLAHEQQQLLTLTEEQYHILDMLNLQRRAAISGCAGSGKTLLALEKATRLAQQGFRVLLTCFNKRLAEHLNQRVAQLHHPNISEQLHIAHFHKICSDFAHRAGIPFSTNTNDNTFYRHDMPNTLLKALDIVPDRYDAIIVDEGQDFYDDWWLPLQMLHSDRDDSIFYIFYDDNQRLYVQSGEFPIKDLQFALTLNCRTTQHIHHQFIRFYKGATTPIPRGPEGRIVQIEHYGDSGMLPQSMQRLLRRLVNTEKIPTDEILVLTPFSKHKSYLWGVSTHKGITLTNDWPPEANHVFCTTIHAFKGLERAVVVLTEIERWTQHDTLEQLLYVACSRACNHLIVFLPEDTPQRVLDLFATSVP